jgi:hypothetical protein
MRPESRSVETLREQAALQGISPTDDDLEAAQAFLEVILPLLPDLERRIPPELAP